MLQTTLPCYSLTAVSSIASLDFRMTNGVVTSAISGSQKGFMLPAVAHFWHSAIKAVKSD